MNSPLKSLVFEVFSFLNTDFFHKKIIKNNITIVMYHSVVNKLPGLYDWCYVDVESFKRQVRYLKKKFEVIPLSQVPLRLKSSVIDKPLAVITFDDGYQNNFDMVFPILKDEGLPGTIFLTTGFINTDYTLWGCCLHHAFSNTKKTRLHFGRKIFDISDHNKKVDVIVLIKKKFKKMTISKILPEFRELLNSLNYDINAVFDHNSLYHMLDNKSIETMNQSGLIEFGAHTVNHEMLSRLSREKQEKEIGDSIKCVSELIGQKCKLFAYPNGTGEDYNKDTIEILNKFGIEIAVTTIEGVINADTPMLELKRYGIGAGMKIGHFKLLVSHILAWSKSFRSFY